MVSIRVFLTRSTAIRDRCRRPRVPRTVPRPLTGFHGCISQINRDFRVWNRLAVRRARTLARQRRRRSRVRLGPACRWVRRRWTRTGRRNRFEWPRVSSARALPNTINSSSFLFRALSRLCRLNHHGWREKPAGPGSRLPATGEAVFRRLAARPDSSRVRAFLARDTRHVEDPRRGRTAVRDALFFEYGRVCGFRDRFYINARESLSAGSVPNRPIDCSSLPRSFRRGYSDLLVNRPAIFAAIAPIPTFACSYVQASDASESVASVHRLLFPRGCHRYTGFFIFFFFFLSVFVFTYLRRSRDIRDCEYLYRSRVHTGVYSSI